MTNHVHPTRRTGLLLLASIAVTSTAEAQSVTLTLATATPGGGFPAFGDAFVAAIRSADPDLRIVTRPSGGSEENVELLRRGEVDLALIQGAYAYPILGQPDGPSVLAPMYATPGLFVVRRDSSIRSVADLRERAVALGTRHSGLTVMGRSVLRASGLDPDRDIRPILLDRAGDGPAMVLDGRAAALWGGGIGWPGFLAVAAGDKGARFIGPSDDAISVLTSDDPSLKALTVPTGSFPGQDNPIRTVGSWSLILAKHGLAPETAFRIVRALSRAKADMRARLVQGDDSDPRNLVGLVPAAWLNAGTARFLSEAGPSR